MDKIEISVPGKIDYMTMLRLTTGSIAHSAGLNIEEIEDLKTCVSEGFKLIYCHHRDCWSSKVKVTYMVKEEEIEIIISDECNGEEMKKVQRPCEHCPQEGNMGYVVLDTLLEEIEFGRNENGYKFVKMVKKYDEKNKQGTV